MLVDFHSHLGPPSWLETRPLPPVLTDLDGFLERKEADGIERTVVCNSMMNVPDDLQLDAIRSWNDFAHGLIERHPESIVASAGINPFGGDETLDEMRRVVDEAGFRAVTINSSVMGESLDSPKLEDFWSLAEELDVPVFIHPPANPPGAGTLRDPRVLEYAGRASDVALAVAAVIFAGVLERHPRLKLVGAAGGGGIAMLIGRLDAAHRFGTPARGRPTGPPPPALPHPPSEYLSRVYADTCVYSAPALRHNLEVFGPERLVFGTDFPPVGIPASVSAELIRGLGLDSDTEERIFSGNALDLLARRG